MLDWSPTSEAAEGRGRREGSAAVILVLGGLLPPAGWEGKWKSVIATFGH